MSYKKAWSLIDAVNKRSEKPVITMSIGGKGGGGATLTAYGKSLVDAFDTINENCWKFLDEQIKQTKLK
jgi:molybdate transport system regulatory protein